MHCSDKCILSDILPKEQDTKDSDRRTMKGEVLALYPSEPYRTFVLQTGGRFESYDFRSYPNLN